MSLAAICARCAGSSRRASRPPWIFGCSVFTRPSRISGEPVKSLTDTTGMPAALSAAAVPPVERISTPSACKPLANSTNPVLSLTLISARSIFPIQRHLDCLQPNGPQVVKQGTGDYVSRMRVTLNGEPRDVRDGLTVAELVSDLGLRLRRIAVEINLDILARVDYPRRRLCKGDVVEIVHFIGGG